jgi:rubrerythrin
LTKKELLDVNRIVMAVNPNEMDGIIDRLTLLNERELTEVTNRVFEVFAKKFENSGDVGQRYVLVRSSFEKGEDKEPYLEFLGVPSEPYLGYVQDGAYESGGCPTCGVIVACVDKLATCPVCGTTKVEFT